MAAKLSDFGSALPNPLPPSIVPHSSKSTDTALRACHWPSHTPAFQPARLSTKSLDTIRSYQKHLSTPWRDRLPSSEMLADQIGSPPPPLHTVSPALPEDRRKGNDLLRPGIIIAAVGASDSVGAVTAAQLGPPARRLRHLQIAPQAARRRRGSVASDVPMPVPERSFAESQSKRPDTCACGVEGVIPFTVERSGKRDLDARSSLEPHLEANRCMAETSTWTGSAGIKPVSPDNRSEPPEDSPASALRFVHAATQTASTQSPTEPRPLSDGAGTPTKPRAERLGDERPAATTSTISRRGVRLRGLDNLGNTCYMNCSLQCLAACKTLSDKLVDVGQFFTAGVPLSPAQELVCEYSHILREMRTSHGAMGRASRSIRPVTFKQKLDVVFPQFRGYQQHDAPEFVTAFIDLLHETLDQHPKAPIAAPTYDGQESDEKNEQDLAKELWKNYRRYHLKHPLLSTLHGVQYSSIQCTQCQDVSLSFEPFSVLTLPVVKDVTKTLHTFQDALDCYLAPETLTLENQWHCPRCQRLRDATKIMKFSRLPHLLVVHLKRFAFKRTKFEKLNHLVRLKYDQSYCGGGFCQKFPRVQQRDALYRLIGVVDHAGKYSSGHYSAKCWYDQYNRWVKFDDNIVTILQDPENEVIHPNTYVLFFERLIRSFPGGITPRTYSTYPVAEHGSRTNSRPMQIVQYYG